MTKRLALLVITFIVVSIPLGIFSLIRTDSGSEWLLRKIFLVLPAQVSVATIDGRLLDRVGNRRGAIGEPRCSRSAGWY